jgi:hypothetical protein
MSANPNVREARCPGCGSWECGTVCRFEEDRTNAYAEAKIRAERLRGYPEVQERDERAPDGRRLYR